MSAYVDIELGGWGAGGLTPLFFSVGRLPASVSLSLSPSLFALSFSLLSPCSLSLSLCSLPLSFFFAFLFHFNPIILINAFNCDLRLLNFFVGVPFEVAAGGSTSCASPLAVNTRGIFTLILLLPGFIPIEPSPIKANGLM